MTIAVDWDVKHKTEQTLGNYVVGPMPISEALVCECGFFFILTLCMLMLSFYKINKIFQQHSRSDKQFGSRSGPTFCRS